MSESNSGMSAAPTSAGYAAGEPAIDQGPIDVTVVLEVLRHTTLVGATAAQLAAATNISLERVQALLDRLVADAQITVLSQPHGYLDNGIASDLTQHVLDRLALRQREQPWLMGVTLRGLAKALSVPEHALRRVLTAYVDAGRLTYRSGYYATLEFRPRLAADQQAFFDAAFVAQTDAEPMPVARDRLRALMQASTAADLAPALETLFAVGELIQVSHDVYRSSQLRVIRARLEAALQQSGQITVAQFRDLTGTSRRYAVPLLEFFDAAGLTIRSGDIRTLRSGATPDDSS